MAVTDLPSERLFEQSLRQGQVRHAIKVALACSLATVVVYYFHVSSGQLAPLFAFLLFTVGMPSPRMNWLLTQIAVVIGAIGSSIILVYFHDTLFLYLALMLLWIFVCLLFSGWLPLPATLAGMISAISVFTYLDSGLDEGLGAAFYFFVDYNLNFLIGGLCLVAVHTFIWPLNAQKVFVRRLAQTYEHLEQECRQGADCLRTGESLPSDTPLEDWSPFRPLRQLVAPELFRGRETSNPFAGLILTCRSLNLRLWFFNRTLGGMQSVAQSADVREQLASRLDGIAAHLAKLVAGAVKHRPVSPVDESVVRDVDFAYPGSGRVDPLLAHQVHGAILHMLAGDLQNATKYHNELFAKRDRGFQGELVSLWPGPNRAALFDVQSVRSGLKLVLILALLMVEEGWLGLPGGAQVAFFATFFASTANLGRQNKTDLIDIVGLLSGFAYGVVAAFLTSRLPHFPLLLALVFLGQFLADLAFQRIPRYSVAGLQAGLAIPFTLLATTGPEWGSFTTVRTRLAGLLLAGFTAVAVHACVWPVMPMRQLRESIAAALRSTAESLVELFAAPRATWKGSPPGLAQTIVRARDLLDDARYLPGPEHADLTYNGILASLQEIDACLDYIHLLLSLGEEMPAREQFFEVVGDYPTAAHTNLEAVARQFDHSSSQDQSLDWKPNVTERWDASPESKSFPATEFESSRLVVIARCLDRIAADVERISSVAREIDNRYSAKS